MENRAGEYVNQPTGYSAFYPRGLPPEPPVEVKGKLQEQLSKADRALGRLDGTLLVLPNPELFVYMYIRKEAVLSSQIEGTQSSLQDVLAAEAKLFDPDRPNDVAAVINYIAAINYGLKRLETLPVSTRMIKEIHEKLMQGVRGSHLTPGEIRKTQNWIGPGGSSLNEASFIPPPPDELPELLSDLEKYLHSDSMLPLLVKIGLAHAQFETIHPFLDGNGRIGRLLITFLLCERKVLSKPVLYLSYYLKNNRSEYYEKLQNIRRKGEWEEWLLFFLRGVEEVSTQASLAAKQIILLRENHRSLITETFSRSAGGALQVLENLYTNPIVSVREVQEITGTSYPPANELVKSMEEIKILREITGRKRHRRYMYWEYVNLFRENSP
ncbi:MAG: Fic family protein [Candidatus Sabulitectum sp.]|nr:Fic family protein [Candidatus Sabulitectum sp.]